MPCEFSSEDYGGGASFLRDNPTSFSCSQPGGLTDIFSVEENFFLARSKWVDKSKRCALVAHRNEGFLVCVCVGKLSVGEWLYVGCGCMSEVDVGDGCVEMCVCVGGGGELSVGEWLYVGCGCMSEVDVGDGCVEMCVCVCGGGGGVMDV